MPVIIISDEEVVRRLTTGMVLPTPDGCLEWMGGTDHSGYGRTTWRKQDLPAHRIAYELFVGPIPEGLIVCHTCDNPPCVNPAHLWLGTDRDNVHDCMKKGRRVQWPSLKLYCNHGHEFTEENTRRYRNRRYCRACQKRMNQDRPRKSAIQNSGLLPPRWQ